MCERPPDPKRRPVVLDMTQSQCVWSRAGVVPSRACHNGFDCTTCSYDQMLDDAMPLVDTDPAVDDVAGFERARGHYLSRGHVWVRVEYGGRLRIGMDDFAARLLGPLDDIRLPRLGGTLEPDLSPLRLARGSHTPNRI